MGFGFQKTVLFWCLSILAAYFASYGAFKLSLTPCRFYFGEIFSLVVALWVFVFVHVFLFVLYLHDRIIWNRGFLGLLPYYLHEGNATAEKLMRVASFFSDLLFSPFFLPSQLHGLWAFGISLVFPTSKFLAEFNIDNQPRNCRRESISSLIMRILVSYVCFIEQWAMGISVVIFVALAAFYKYFVLLNC